MRNAKCPGLLDTVLAETIPMYGRMVHGEKKGKLFEESQSYDIHGRVIHLISPQGKSLTTPVHQSSRQSWAEQESPRRARKDAERVTQV